MSGSFLIPALRAEPVPGMAPAPSLSEADQKKLHETSKQLEATFTSFMMEEFNKGLPGGGDSFASQVYADMFKQNIASKVAESGSGKGLADQIYKASEKNALRHGGSHPSAADAAAPLRNSTSLTLRAMAAATPFSNPSESSSSL